MAKREFRLTTSVWIYDALRYAGCSEIFRDYGISGATVERPALRQALGLLKLGDTLVCWRLDRLGRSPSHLIGVISEYRSISFASFTEAIDIQTTSGRLLFHIMGALAEFERALISERTRAGMAAAQVRGVRVGRPMKLSAEQLARAQVEPLGWSVWLYVARREASISVTPGSP